MTTAAEVLVRDCANRLDQLFRQDYTMREVEAELRRLLRAALATPQAAPAQPVAWRYLYHDPHGSDMRIWHNSSNWNGMTPIESQPLYASPQPDEAVALLRALEPHLDKLICYASTTDEYEPNAIVARIRAFLKDRT